MINAMPSIVKFEYVLKQMYFTYTETTSVRFQLYCTGPPMLNSCNPNSHSGALTVKETDLLIKFGWDLYHLHEICLNWQIVHKYVQVICTPWNKQL